MTEVSLRPKAALQTAQSGVLRRRTWRPSVIGAGVFVLVVALTATLSWFAHTENESTESRLLRLQTRQTGILLQSFVQSLQTPLASAAQIAQSTGGASRNYSSYASSFLHRQARFVSVSLWRVRRGSRPVLVDTIGQTPRLTSSSQQVQFLTRVSRSGEVGVVDFLHGAVRHLGYAFASTQTGSGYVVYAEDTLRARYRRSTPASSPFADLRYALYFGTELSRRTLLATSERHLPLTGRTARIVVPFGTSSLTLVAAPVGVLGGSYADSRWWIIAILGSLIALAAGLAADRLVKRRRSAEALAEENAELLRGQRTIAESLQRAMMPQDMPIIPGLEIAARYFPGVNGIEIGGDWYDVIALDEERFFFVIGDVSGRGLEAGAIMAALHFAIRGFVREGHDPATVLTLLTRLLDITRDKHFATVVCGFGDIPAGRVTIANAGHLPPLILSQDTSEFVTTDLGPPIGVRASFAYRTVTIDMAPGSTLLVFTDGLIERRTESIDDGLARLQGSAHAHLALDDMLATILTDLTPHGADDDTAILALRWTGTHAPAPSDSTHAALRAVAGSYVGHR